MYIDVMSYEYRSHGYLELSKFDWAATERTVRISDNPLLETLGVKLVPARKQDCEVTRLLFLANGALHRARYSAVIVFFRPAN